MSHEAERGFVFFVCFFNSRMHLYHLSLIVSPLVHTVFLGSVFMWNYSIFMSLTRRRADVMKHVAAVAHFSF